MNSNKTQLVSRKFIPFKQFFLLCLLIGMSHTVFAQPAGTLDISFGNGGKVTTDFGNYTEGQDIAIKDNGSIIGLSRYNVSPNYYSLTQYNSNGAVDNSFANNGTYVSDFAVTTDVRMALQSDGKIIVLGTTNVSPNVAFLIRHLADGSIDASFGNQGRADVSWMGNSTHGTAIATLNDNSIVIAGYTQAGSPPNQYIAKLTADGALDTSFGTAGFTTSTLSGTNRPEDIVITSSGDIITCGESSVGLSALNVTKYLSNGNLDTSFGTDGIFVNSSFGNGVSVALQSDGKIVTTGQGFTSSQLVFGVLRLNADGTEDTTFGNGGVAYSGTAESNNPYGIAVDSEDRILVCGESPFASTDAKLILVRFDSDGTLDPEFGDAGTATAVFNTNNLEVAMNIGLQNDGKIVVVGRSGLPFASGSLILARFFHEINTAVADLGDQSVLTGINVFPNPVVEDLTMNFTIEEKTTLRIDLLDASGRYVLNAVPSTQYASGVYEEKIHFQNALPTGNYFLLIQDEGKTLATIPLAIGK